MALWKGKTEHSGPKNRGRKSGFWGKRNEAKTSTKKQRRQDDKKAAQEDARK